MIKDLVLIPRLLYRRGGEKFRPSTHRLRRRLRNVHSRRVCAASIPEVQRPLIAASQQNRWEAVHHFYTTLFSSNGDSHHLFIFCVV